MKRLVKIVLILVIAALVARELGWINFELFNRWSEKTTSRVTSIRGPIPATRLAYEEDTGQPYMRVFKYPEDDYEVTVRYRVLTSLSPWRWVPFYKWGSNKVQVTYLVWSRNGLLGCGAISMEGTQTIWGVFSARRYRAELVDPLIQEMKKELEPQIEIFVNKIQPSATPGQK